MSMECEGMCVCVCILLGYTNWSEGKEETIIGPYIFSAPITQVVMTAGEMAMRHPLQPT